MDFAPSRRPFGLPTPLALAAALALLTFSGRARADLGPPPSCPAGQTSRYLYGHYCGPISCERDDQCGGAKCEERSLCVHDRGHGGASRAWEQTGECPTGDCPAESQCGRERFCGAPPARAAEPAVDPTPAMRPTSRGCGCDTTSLRDGAPAWSVGAAGLALAVLAGLGWRRARRR
jgi:hypothetical protein